MTEYNLLVLSPNEFEEFSRDLLQEKLGVFIESFKTGKDGGIDLRYAKQKGETSIIQAKRYTTYSSLISNLKKEVAKVKALNPVKYLVTTTVGLTPFNKNEIKNLFEPYIESTGDILGKEDLNNLLYLNKKIEEKYYKLWISSTNILNKVLHSKIYNQSNFELEEIKNQITLYVQNESFNTALSILDKHRYVIISGIPGIGKTTLSRIITLYLLSNNFDEFVYLNDSIDDGYKYFYEDSKQVFLFDDFLGRNFFDAKHLPKNDDKIVKFIQKIKKSPNKVLILVTREYILSQARLSYETFEISNIEIAKCILDLSTYTSIIKAKIFYNHLFYGNVPVQYIKNIVEGKRYNNLISHKNYNPRIIETIIKKQIWNTCEPHQFYETLKRFFDNPKSVWLHSFENSLDKFSQYALLVLASIGTPILLKDLEKAVKEFIIINNYKFLINFDSIKFLRSIKELENTFITTYADCKGELSIDYQNPSIFDFLINYLYGKNDIIEDILKTSVFIEQFVTIFTTDVISGEYIDRITLNGAQVNIAIDRLLEIENRLINSRIFKVHLNNSKSFYYLKRPEFIYSFLVKIKNQYSIINEKALEFVYKRFQANILLNNLSDNYGYFELLRELDLGMLVCNDKQVINNYLNKANWVEDIEDFENFKGIFPKTYNETISSYTFINKVTEIVDNYISDLEDSEANSMKYIVEKMQMTYNLNLADTLKTLLRKKAAMKSYSGTKINMEIKKKEGEREEREEETIDEIFNSLKENYK